MKYKYLILVFLVAVGGFLAYKYQKSSSSSSLNPSVGNNENEFKPPTDFPPFPPSLSEPEGVLRISDDPSKGNLMLQLDQPIGFIDSNSKVEMTYIRTSRDYSTLIGKRVRVILKDGGDPLDFVLDDIIPLE